MGKRTLVIGGTRYFGKTLVHRLLDAGHQVTLATRGRMVDDFGSRVQRIQVDRRDPTAMRSAFSASEGFDLVYDQMCYTPQDAEIAIDVLGGRVSRYLMASTIDVYLPWLGLLQRPYLEDDLDFSNIEIDRTYPWHLPELAGLRYSAGKQQAEALLLSSSRLSAATVRIGHVLGGPEDFTGRLAFYVKAAKAKIHLAHAGKCGASSFIGVDEISQFLMWAGDASFVGPVNAANPQAMSAVQLQRRITESLGVPCLTASVSEDVHPCQLSPFDFPKPHAMDVGRAMALGFSFDPSNDWLDELIVRHAKAVEGESA